MKKLYLISVLLLSHFISFSQQTFPSNGVKEKKTVAYLLKNATVIVDSKTKIENGWVLIKGNKIEKVGKDFNFPKETVIIDLSGKYVYPGFVESFTDYGMPETKSQAGGGYYSTKFDSDKKGAYAWNQAIKPELKAHEIFSVDSKKAAEFRKLGFTVGLVHNIDGIARGNSALVDFSDTKEQESLIKANASTHFSFNKGSSTQTYPVSLMGAVALLRQTFIDADWYKKGGNALEKNISLDEFGKNLAFSPIFHSNNVLDLLRADKIGDEFGQQFIIKTNGDEYQKVDEVKNTNAKLIVPINFPAAFDIEDYYDSKAIKLSELKHWEMAPSNPAILEKNNIGFSISTYDLKDKSAFYKNIRKAIENGLSKEKALAALSSEAAQILKIDNLVGSIKPGLLANIIVCSNEIFDEKNEIIDTWIQGKVFHITDYSIADKRGKYDMLLSNNAAYKLEISGEYNKPKFEIYSNDTLKLSPKVSLDNDFISIQFKANKADNGLSRLSGYFANEAFQGSGQLMDGTEITWTTKTKVIIDQKVKTDTTAAKKTQNFGDISYPFGAYGSKSLAKASNVLIKNATVWTNEKEGVLKETDVLIENGKISKVAKSIVPITKDVQVIDGTGKHVTTGIIDEHSHIALFSINEIETVSAEVRQEDVIDSDDIDIYRQLAGGVTTSQLLHGSADCIGGQSAIIKLKWGETAEKLKIPNAPGFIKFALGENVKRGNSPSAPNRFPSTRMGVEQVFLDAFTRAKQYKKDWENYNNTKIKTGLLAPKRDLELDALVEILDNKRFITCHSYVQSEINMLMKLADSLGFKINTFTHILEGYKVADKMKDRKIYGSTFSDWWAYKMEVKEAIPYNAAIMNKVGVQTAINSDDAEMARRLNQEAAKTVLYGGLSEEEAWKTITLNPATMLHLDDKLGSMKPGKDADLVIWNANPLSIYAKPEKTIIEGAVYFDIEKNAQLETMNTLERNRIIQKMINEKSNGAATVKPVAKPKVHAHCDTMLEFGGISIEEWSQNN